MTCRCAGPLLLHDTVDAGLNPALAPLVLILLPPLMQRSALRVN